LRLRSLAHKRVNWGGTFFAAAMLLSNLVGSSRLDLGSSNRFDHGPQLTVKAPVLLAARRRQPGRTSS
jgi:hypothetical protein